MSIYGYVRISTAKQNERRQISNIKALYPDAVIITEVYTGTKIERPKWKRLDSLLKSGDTVVFDEVSRMSRNAEEGFLSYKNLYERGVNLVFLKESTLNTSNFRETAQIALTGNDVDVILEGVNRYLMILAENQIKTAFKTAEHEVELLHKRTAEGVRRAQADGKRVGTPKGAKLTTKKSIEAKKKIAKYSKCFNGTLKDVEVIEFLRIAPNTYYKYKKEMMGDIERWNLQLTS